MKCPNCSYQFIHKFNHEDVGATLDCPNCNELLIVTVTVTSFHKHMHSLHPEWPEDGNNTSYIDV